MTAGESQACALAAKERIDILEQETEAAAAEHQQALEAAAQTLKDAQEAAAKELLKAQEAAAAEAKLVAAQHEVAVKRVQAELDAVKVRPLQKKKACIAGSSSGV